jgi:CRISPR/Cas system CSM-associated protein Csm3 (group 7 of RAMP superfamily)
MFWAIELQFQSPVHVGAGSSDAYMGAANIVKNGAGEYVIPGSSLAGLFFAGMRCSAKRGADDKSLFNKIMSEESQNAQDASHLMFRTISLKPRMTLLRDRVRINPETKTAADKAKFAQWEILPENTIMLLELDNVSKKDNALTEDEVLKVTTWINQVLASWYHEGFFMGAYSAVGNGYTQVVSAKTCTLTRDNYKEYRKSSYDGLSNSNMGWDVLPLKTINDFNRTYSKRYKITLKTGLHDPLLIKGNSFYPSHTNPDTDAPFIHRDGTIFIPGSSIRGAIGAFMKKYGILAWAELTGQATSDPTISSIKFTDLLSQGSLNPIQIEHHAEDQLSRAIFGGGKFDEERVFDTIFQGEILVSKAFQTHDDDKLQQIFEFLASGMKFRQISLGAGAAHPEMSIEEVK